jgi:hypothetical protein
MTTGNTFSGPNTGNIDVPSTPGLNTGDIDVPSTTVMVPFDRYEIVLELGPHREFLKIIEVRISKDFRSVQQKVESTGYHDVSELYEE